jgi:hypothetical protein
MAIFSHCPAAGAPLTTDSETVLVFAETDEDLGRRFPPSYADHIATNSPWRTYYFKFNVMRKP